MNHGRSAGWGAIWLNGDENAGEDGETFGIAPGDAVVEGFTKTYGLPYDLAVSAVLLRAKALAPEAVELSSDTSDVSDTWAEGASLLMRLGLHSGRP